ncbi:Palmitoyltransferase [Mycena kentingensis (nom. inval.)]|nr:Palmitoyltransferase [Mycena kentingensis (nom. inval.)]
MQVGKQEKVTAAQQLADDHHQRLAADSRRRPRSRRAPSAMICARTVFRCFKVLERIGDRVTGAAGPVFVTFAVLLVGLGTTCFFTILLPTLPFPILTTPLCVLIALNLHGHYFYVTRVRPGFVDPSAPLPTDLAPPIRPLEIRPGRIEDSRVLWANRGAFDASPHGKAPMTRATVTKCRRCGVIRPERAHHCRICNRCVLKYDHHCPHLHLLGINQCVGLHNERHFVLFMAYLVIGCLAFCFAGWDTALHALGFSGDWNDWPYTIPATFFLLTYILAAVMSLAVGIMCAFHLRTIANGETTVESQDHDVYRKVAVQRQETFTNSYDLGPGLRNLALFFNVSIGRYKPSPAPYPLYTLLLPVRVQPYTDGWGWARREGYERGHGGVRRGEELTDEEFGEDHMEEP